MRRRMAFVLVVAGLALGALEGGALALCSTAQGAEFIFRVNKAELLERPFVACKQLIGDCAHDVGYYTEETPPGRIAAKETTLRPVAVT